MVCMQGHEYFSYLGQKTQQEAANQAKIDVSEARMKGEMGSKEREGHTLQNASKIDAETKVYSTKRRGEGKKEEIKVETEVRIFQNKREAEVAQANTELAMQKANWSKQSQVAEIEAAKSVAIREAELQIEVEVKNALKQTEKLKAEFISKATIDTELKKQEADQQLYKKQKEAEAALYEQVQIAEGQKEMAKANFFTVQQEADALLYGKQKKGEGIIALAEAEGAYLQTLLTALGGNYAALRDYLMINRGIYQEIAKINADGVQGLNPKISVWSGVGGEATNGEAGGAMKEVAGVYKMLPPLFQTVQEQTGMLPPSWMGSIPTPTKNNN